MAAIVATRLSRTITLLFNVKAARMDYILTRWRSKMTPTFLRYGLIVSRIVL